MLEKETGEFQTVTKNRKEHSLVDAGDVERVGGNRPVVVVTVT